MLKTIDFFLIIVYNMRGYALSACPFNKPLIIRRKKNEISSYISSDGKSG